MVDVYGRSWRERSVFVTLAYPPLIPHISRPKVIYVTDAFC